MTSDIPKVALLIETARSYGRGVLRGVVHYARLHGPWSFYMTPGDFEQALPKMEQWGGTGIIARVENQKVADAILATGLPLVALDLSEKQLAPHSRLANVYELLSDSQGAACMAAEHLLDTGFIQYAFVGLPDRIWSQRRQVSFVQRIARAGHDCHVYPAPRRRDREWGREQVIMAQWLAKLPKPVGIMACNDDRGREVLEACRAAGVRVPEDAAVIGVDNDELLCELSDPPLSSVALNAQRGGFEAAALLDELMRGQAKGRASTGGVARRGPASRRGGRDAAPRRIVVEPLQVVARRSTEVVALDDPEVVAAMKFIRDHTGQPIRVRDVVEAVGLSRRAMEIRFMRTVGRSLNHEIQRARLERAKRLLRESDLSIPQVAEAAGYGGASYLAEVFHEHFGVTPVKYRAKVRNH